MADEAQGPDGARILAFPGVGINVTDAIDRAKQEAGGVADEARRQANAAVNTGRKAVEHAAGQAAQFADLSKPPDLLVQAIREFTSRPSVQADLRRTGTRAADAAVDAALAAVVRRKAAPGARPATPNPWMTGVVDPIANPVMAGFKTQLGVRARPYVKRAVLVAGGVALGLFLLGRWTAPKRAS